MSKIITNVADAQSVKLNKEYRKLTSELDSAVDSIHLLEVQLSELYKKKYDVEKQIKQIEETVVSSVIR